MTRLSKFQAKIAFSFCTLFCLYSPLVFSQQVDTAWVRRYNGPGNGDDKAVAIAVDSGGNVYVTGSSLDSTTGYDYCTIKYLPNGDTAWVRRYNGPPNDTDLARDMILDDKSNVYITGRSGGDILTLKYDSSGNELWVRRFTTLLNFIETTVSGGYALGLDGYGNLYVTGQEWDEGSLEWYLLKYDSSGNLLWVWHAVPEGGRQTFDLALDSIGNAYIAADSQIIRVDLNGNQHWVQNFPVRNGIIRAVALDRNDNVYVTGGPGVTITTKYDSSGNQLWVRTRHFDFGGGPARGGFDVVTDKQSNVLVFGDAWDVEAAINFLVKYDSLGNELWFFYGTFSDFTYSRKVLTVDTSGNAYLTFVSSFTTVKLDSNGNEIWYRYFYAPGFGNPLSTAITLDSKGGVYLTGTVEGSGTKIDYLTIKYSPLPQLKGDLNLDGTLSTADVVLSINCTFLGEAPPAAPAACDINCDGKVTAADAVVLMFMVFLSTPAPC